MSTTQEAGAAERGPYYEDYREGESFHQCQYHLDEEEIVSFAETYDPQPFHTDPAVAEESFFEGLSASGWQTAAITMRLFVDFLGVSGPAGSIGLGVDDLRWHSPVRPDETLCADITVEERRPWDEEHGYLRFGMDVHTPDETKLTAVIVTLFERRDSE
ncbi:MAG: MaoC/PaaZ C-terminal domain-containing protein [Halobaculum sp.]